MKDHYSFLAPFYNRLSKLVFGDQLMLAKTCFAKNLPEKRILIIGGGDGLDYQKLQKQLAGEYWEISKAMLTKAKSNLPESKLIFHLDFYHAEKGKVFDEVWLQFVLDTMGDEEIVSLLKEIRKSLTSEGVIYLADFFVTQTSYHRILNRIMITFFRIVTKHKRANLPDYEEFLGTEKYKKISEKKFLKGWVKAQIWKS